MVKYLSLIIVFISSWLSGVFFPKPNNPPSAPTPISPLISLVPSPPAPTLHQVTPTIKIINRISPIPTRISIPTLADSGPWGVSKQIGDHTWTIRLNQDATMATPEEILKALNEYRQVHGSQILILDEKLTNYAQSRAVYINSKKTVDQHQGFNDFVLNQDGFNKLGFNTLGENISYGYKLIGVHLIEWMYAGDKPHNDNQLNSRWNYVGVGVNGLATCLIFGTGKF